MRDDLIGLLEKADLAIASASDVVEQEKLDPLIEAIRSVRHRLSYPDDVLVVALAGGTGSGKSSLFNAIAGEDLVEVGGVRPTTSHPTAALPESVGSAMDGYLDRLGITERHPYQGPRICLIDLPDTDSVEIDHRHRVDAVLPLVDVVVWVTDPEKYRDARLHDEYLKPMSPYSAQFVFALNQVDRLSPDDVEEVNADLEVALEEDWLESVAIVTVAASPTSGPPIGIEDLLEVLEEKGADKSALYGKLLTDVAEAGHALESETGTGLDFDPRATEALDEAAGAIVDRDPGAASEVLTGFLGSLAAESGGETSHKLESLAADVPSHVRRIDERLAPADPKPKRSWFRRRREEPRPAPDRDVAQSLLAEAVIRPARAIVARRAVAVASVAELAVEVGSLRRATSR